jgi:glutamate synthase (NADPH/NADH) small chain
VPDFKNEKTVVVGRVRLLEAVGVVFRFGVEVGVDVDPAELRERHDAVVLAVGARVPRDLPVPGRELDGVRFAMEYLYERNRAVAGAQGTISAAGRHVVVIGGGDTGADCVAQAHRQGARSVTQIELVGEPPPSRPDAITPWPRWPMKLRGSYALAEGGERDFALSTTAFTGEEGRVERIHWARNTGVPPFELVPGTEESRPAELVLLAMGFLGPEGALAEQLGLERDARSNFATGSGYETSLPGVFAAGDARRGQSLVVWAIAEGRRCAAAVDAALKNGEPRAAAVTRAG